MEFKAKIRKVTVAVDTDGRETIKVDMEFGTMCAVEHLRMLAHAAGWLDGTLTDPQASFSMEAAELIRR